MVNLEVEHRSVLEVKILECGLILEGFSARLQPQLLPVEVDELALLAADPLLHIADRVRAGQLKLFLKLFIIVRYGNPLS